MHFNVIYADGFKDPQGVKRGVFVDDALCEAVGAVQSVKIS